MWVMDDTLMEEEWTDHLEEFGQNVETTEQSRPRNRSSPSPVRDKFSVLGTKWMSNFFEVLSHGSGDSDDGPENPIYDLASKSDDFEIQIGRAV